MKKWIALTIWLVSCIVFVSGQLLAPPDYHLILNNPWGKVFSISVVVGILSFISFLFFVLTEKKHISKQKTVKKSHKYNLSVARILSRIILTGFLGIIFGIAMFPFLTVADGLLYQQKVAIGEDNMIRAVALWGLFTLIVTLFTFWKKRFRMVSVLLICCWILSFMFLLVILIIGRNDYSCKRSSPMVLPQEVNRSLDLISQRMGIDVNASGTVLQSAFNFRNCLNIQYSETDSGEEEGYFIFDEASDLQNLQVFISPSYKNYDDLTLATLLVHELVHVGQLVNKVTMEIETECFASEAQAFVSQSIFTNQLNEEERRSIYTRLADDVDKNPIFNTTLLADQRVSESYNACLQLQKSNNLTDQQLNECTWTGAQNKIEADVRENPYYQQQCIQ